jgi:hypothetical protein
MPFFQKLGYRQVFPDVVHPEYGCVVPMILALLDQDHLEKIGSPFAKHARGVADARQSVSFFREKFLVKSDDMIQKMGLAMFGEHNLGAGHDAIIN